MYRRKFSFYSSAVADLLKLYRIVEREAPIQVSNVAIFNPSTGKADRVGFRVEDGKKVRIYKSSGEAVDA